MSDEDAAEIEFRSEEQSYQQPNCPFCKNMGTPKGTRLLFIVWVLIPVLLLLMVLVSQL